MLVAAEMFGSNAQLDIPPLTRVDPAIEPLLVGAGLDEVLDFHLFEFERPKDEVPRRNFVPERLSHLRNTEGQLSAHGCGDVEKVDEHALRGLGWEIRDVLVVGDWADVRLEHGVEWPRLAEQSATIRAFCSFDLVRAKAALTLAHALDKRVVELFDVTRSDPHPRRSDQRRVEQLHVIAPLNVGSNPGIAHVVLEQRPERTVIVRIGEPAVDLSASEDKTAALAQSDHFLQVF